MTVSLILNCLIVLMTGFGFAAMFKGWNFMGKAGQLDTPGLEVFKYYTVDSNVLAGICSFIMAGAEILVLQGKVQEVSPLIYALKLTGTGAVTMTLMVTVFFLRPQFEHPEELFYNSNLFFHLVTPLTAVLSFVFTEHGADLPFMATVAAIIPTFLYALVYMRSVLIHAKDGKALKTYDFYDFLGGKIRRTPAAFTVVMLISWIFCVLLWAGNKL